MPLSGKDFGCGAVVKDAPIVPVAWVCGYAGETRPQMTRRRLKTRPTIPMRYLPFIMPIRLIRRPIQGSWNQIQRDLR